MVLVVGMHGCASETEEGAYPVRRATCFHLFFTVLLLLIAACTGSSPPTPTPTPISPTASPVLDIPTHTPTPSNTQTATYTPRPTWTPIPTLSVEEMDALRQRWILDLETAAGFNHPVFDEFVDEWLETPWGDSWLRRNMHMTPKIEELNFVGDTYVAMIVDDSDHFMGHGLLLFRLVDGEPQLIPNPIRYDYSSDFLNFAEEDYQEVTAGFADRNGNGYPDLTVYASSGGNCGLIMPLILEIHPGGEVVDLTPFTSMQFRAELVDLNNDGVLEQYLRQNRV
jgi:hypothetical protein